MTPPPCIPLLQRRYQFIAIVFAALELAPTIDGAFSSPQPPKSPFGAVGESLKKRILGGQPQEPPDEVSILKQIDLQSSTDPQRFSIAPGQFLDVATSSFQFALRGGSGAFADGYRVSIGDLDASTYSVASIGEYKVKETCSPSARTKAPLIPLELYEFEACPFCRKVREAVSILSLEVLFKPCPKKSPRYRKEIKEGMGPKATFPFLVDPNTGIEMFESDDIVSYLFQAYGDGEVPLSLRLGPATTITAALGLLPRLGRGGTYRTSNPPSKPMVIWSYEASPFCKLVKETMCELELAHVQVSCPRGSPNRQKLFDKMGRFQVPFLEDPNVGQGEEAVQLFESAAIVEYLTKRYGVSASPVKYM